MTKERDYSILEGDELLVAKCEWWPQSEMNTDSRIIQHAMFEKVFVKIVEDHQPTKPIAFFSLCTKTRPYGDGYKWRKFSQLYGDVADLIVVSTGGIIPQKYWNSYPYLNYDSIFNQKTAQLFRRVVEKRLTIFLENNKYDFVVGNFRPTLPHTKTAAKKALSNLKKRKFIRDYKIVPDDSLYDKMKSSGFGKPHGVGAFFPDLHKFNIDEIENVLNDYMNL